MNVSGVSPWGRRAIGTEGLAELRSYPSPCRLLVVGDPDSFLVKLLVAAGGTLETVAEKRDVRAAAVYLTVKTMLAGLVRPLEVAS